MTDDAQRGFGVVALYARLAVVLVFALGLAWLAISQTAAHRLSAADPLASLAWRRSNSEGLAAVEQSYLSGANTPADFDLVKARIADELERAPMTLGAFRDLAEVAELHPGSGSADAFMAMSNRLTRRDNQTEQWLFFHRLAAADYPQAMLQADLYARRNRDSDQWLLFLPQLIPALRSASAREALVGRLVLRPEWRPSFMSDLISSGPDLSVIEDIFARLHKANSGPDTDEISPLALRMLGDGRFAEARAVWGSLVGHPPDGANLIYDGDFQGWRGPPPFNWRLQDQGGVFSERTTTADGEGALRAELPGDNSELLAEQQVVAPAGHYRFSGRVMVERVALGGAFDWAVWCSATNTSLATAKFDSAGAWRPFQVDLVAPDTCGTLSIRLQSEGGDGGGQAIAWSDRLSLAPQGPG